MEPLFSAPLPRARARRIATYTAAALAGVLVASCGTHDTLSETATQTVSSAPAPRSRPALPEIQDASADRVLSAVREPGAKAVVVNVWATWCVPCREEFPDLMKLSGRYEDRGLRLVLVSADFDDQLGEARRFLAQQGVEFVTYHKIGDDMKFINALDPKWTGALPATLVYDGHGVLRHFWEGRATFDKMESSVLDVLTAQQASRTKEN
jgi:thiol-disulfide isomerase/thioredoxin